MTMAASCVAGAGSMRAVSQQCATPSCSSATHQQAHQGSSAAVRHVSALRSRSAGNGFAVQVSGNGMIDGRRSHRRWPSSSSTVRATTDKVEADVQTVSSGDGVDEECNDASCAPEKEVGKLSVGWEVQERTKVTGTYPPMSKPGDSSSLSSSSFPSPPPPPPSPSTRAWTGYVEKDTAGQTNIYSVEPTVYVSDGVMSSTTLSAGIGGLLALLGVGGALLYVGTNKPADVVEPTSTAPVERLDRYSGRSEVKKGRGLGQNLPEDFPVQAPETAAELPTSPKPAAEPATEAVFEAAAEAEVISSPTSS